MKILIFNEFYTPNITGGAEISTQVLAEALVRQGHNVTVCTSASKDYEDVINGVKVYYLSLNPLYWAYKCKDVSKIKKLIWHTIDVYNIFAQSKVNKIVYACNPDIIHTSNLSHFSCIVWKLAHSKHIPVCHTLRDFYLMCLKCTLFNGEECTRRCRMCKMFSEPKRLLTKYVDGVVGISSFILNKHLENNYFADVNSTEVIYNPIKVPSSNPVRQFGRIGYIGSLLPSKGIEQLINSFIKINDTRLSLVIAGDGKDEDYVKMLKEKSNGFNIHFMGRMKPSEFFSQVDLLVVPSLWNEPFGRVVVESINYGVPVIATRKGGITEILEGRSEGILYDPSNDDALTDLLKAYSERALTFNFSDVDSFSAKYKEDTCAASYANFYKKLIRK